MIATVQLMSDHDSGVSVPRSSLRMKRIIYGSSIIFSGIGYLYYIYKMKKRSNEERVYWNESTQRNVIYKYISNMFDFLCIDYPLIIKPASMIDLIFGNVEIKILSVIPAVILPHIHSSLYFHAYNSSFYYRIRRIYLLHTKSCSRWRLQYNLTFFIIYSMFSISELLYFSKIYDFYTSKPELKKDHPVWAKDANFLLDPIKYIKTTFFWYKWIISWLFGVGISFMYNTGSLHGVSNNFDSVFFNEKENETDIKISNEIKLNCLINYDKTTILSDEIILKIFEFGYGNQLTAKQMISQILYDFVDRYFIFYGVSLDDYDSNRKIKFIGKTKQFEQMIDKKTKKGLIVNESVFWKDRIQRKNGKKTRKGVWSNLIEISKQYEYADKGRKKEIKEMDEWKECIENEFEQKAKKELFSSYSKWYGQTITSVWWQCFNFIMYDLSFFVRFMHT